MSIKKPPNESEMSDHDAFLAIVATAVAMRDEAGLPVRMGNGQTGFALMIDGWHYRNGRAERVVANAPEVVAKVVANPEVGGSGKSEGQQ